MGAAMSEKYSPEWIREQVEANNASWLPTWVCKFCKQQPGYIFREGKVWERSCDCRRSPDQPSNYEAVADHLRLQVSDDIRDQIMAGLR